jgi:hypothetical protein
MEESADGYVRADFDNYNDYQRSAAIVSIAISLKRIADAQERQADSMDAFPAPVSFDEQLAAVTAALKPRSPV